LGWDESDCEKLDDLYYDFACASRYPDGHQLLGYADSIQTKVTKPGNRLLFQVYSDYFNANMMWGDGGMIYFIIDETDLNRADFSNVTADLHSG